MEFKLNGNTKDYDGDPELSLMTYLRDVEDIISPKDGCAPEGVCGCCSVLLDGNVLKACQNMTLSVWQQEKHLMLQI